MDLSNNYTINSNDIRAVLTNALQNQDGLDANVVNAITAADTDGDLEINETEYNNFVNLNSLTDNDVIQQCLNFNLFEHLRNKNDTNNDTAMQAFPTPGISNNKINNNGANSIQSTTSELLISAGGSKMQPEVLNVLSTALINHISTNNITIDQIPNLILNGFKPYLDSLGISYTADDLNSATAAIFNFSTNNSSDGSQLSNADFTRTLVSQSYENLTQTMGIVNQILKSNYNSTSNEMNQDALSAFSSALVNHLAQNNIDINEVNNLVDNGLKAYFDELGINYNENDLLLAKTSLTNLLMQNNGSLSILDLDTSVRNYSKSTLEKSQDVLNLRLIASGGANMPPQILNALSTALIDYIGNNNISKEQIPNLIFNHFKAYLENQGITYNENDLTNSVMTLYQYAQTYSSNNSLTLSDVISSVQSSNVDGKINDYTEQRMGDCWLMAGVNALASTDIGEKIIQNSIQQNDDGSVTVSFKGIGVSYTLSANEIGLNDTDLQKKGTYSRGDNDMLVIELAAEKLRADINSGKVVVNSSNTVIAKNNFDNGLEGGSPQQIMFYLTGIEANSIRNAENPNENLQSEQVLAVLSTISSNDNMAVTFGLEKGNHSAIMANGLPYNISNNANHALAITNISSDFITFVDSNNVAQPITMTKEEFAKLGIRRIDMVDLSQTTL